MPMLYIYIYASYLNSEFYANDFVCPLDKVECFSLELILDPIKYKFEYVILSMFKNIACVMNILHWKLECITHYTSNKMLKGTICRTC
jgi:hypothetical protein